MQSAQAMQQLASEGTPPVEPQLFIVVNDYTTFSVEFTDKGDNDIQFHFFMTPEIEAKKPTEMNWYWNEAFPMHLDKVAREFFGFEYPQIQASLIQGVLRSDDAVKAQDSWWMIVQKLVVPDVEAHVMQFLEQLDQALESSSLK